jgi:predicted nucleic acid-binding protein
VSTFFDTNVLLYLFDRQDIAKTTIARRLYVEHGEAADLVLSTQVLQEFYAVLRRKRLLPPQLALDATRELAGHDVRGTNADGVLRALALAMQHQLSVWDGLIVQAAMDAGCSTLLTEDLQHGRHYGALQVINPFAPAAHEKAPPDYAAVKKPARASRAPTTRKTASRRR